MTSYKQSDVLPAIKYQFLVVSEHLKRDVHFIGDEVASP